MVEEKAPKAPLVALDRIRALDQALSKKYGDIYSGVSRKRAIEPVNFVSTGCHSLDKVIGGGIPEGRIIEIFGPPSSCKTLIAMKMIEAYQKEGKLCAFIDAEASFDPTFVNYCGVDLNLLAVVEPKTAEQGLESLKDLVRSGVISLVVLDSVAALSPAEEQAKEVQEASMAVLARYLSKVLREMAPVARENKCTIVLINQVRNTLKMYGPSEDTPGGNALKYYTSVRLKVTRKDVIKKSGEEIGIISAVKAMKNKVSAPFREAEMEVYFPHYDEEAGRTIAGIDIAGDTLDAAIEANIINKGGAWYTYKNIRAQGKEKLKVEIVKEGLLQEIQNLLKNKPQLITATTEVVEATSEADLELSENLFES